jgi:two-component system sensor histidine kinase YesM
VFEIKDDGVGMEEARLSDIQSKLEALPPPIDGHGLGLVNVQRRIRYYFGAEFGISIESDHGTGTRVTVCLPYVAEPVAQQAGSR